jgi:hypothetical protein
MLDLDELERLEKAAASCGCTDWWSFCEIKQDYLNALRNAAPAMIREIRRLWEIETAARALVIVMDEYEQGRREGRVVDALRAALEKK